MKYSEEMEAELVVSSIYKMSGKKPIKDDNKMLCRVCLEMTAEVKPYTVGQIWTLHWNFIQLWILIMIWHLTQDKNLTRIKLVHFWPLVLKKVTVTTSQFNSNLSIGMQHFLVKYQTDSFLFTQATIQKSYKGLFLTPNS